MLSSSAWLTLLWLLAFFCNLPVWGLPLCGSSAVPASFYSCQPHLWPDHPMPHSLRTILGSA
jgi:hypothetical protein